MEEQTKHREKSQSFSLEENESCVRGKYIEALCLPGIDASIISVGIYTHSDNFLNFPLDSRHWTPLNIIIYEDYQKTCASLCVCNYN